MNPIVPVILQVLAEIGFSKGKEAFRQSQSSEDQETASGVAAEMTRNIATKADIAGTKAELENEIGDRIDEVKSDIALTSEALNTQVARCRTEIDQVKAKVSEQAAEVRTGIADLRRTLRCIALISAAILASSLAILTKYFFFSG